MNKLMIASLLAASIFSTAAFGKSQRINLCLSVIGNASTNTFTANFKSTDIFDWGSQVGYVRNGQSCVSHQYHFGPKNLTFNVKATNHAAQNDVLLIPDETCGYLQKIAPGLFSSPTIRSEASFLSRQIILYQASPMNGYKYTFNMHCEYAVA